MTGMERLQKRELEDFATVGKLEMWYAWRTGVQVKRKGCVKVGR